MRNPNADLAATRREVRCKIDPGTAESLYGRGTAKLKKGDNRGGNADIAAAKAIKPDIAEDFGRYGVK